MRRRLSLCSTALVLLLAWLAVTTVGRSGDNRFVLEVPATYLSVGQQFQPRLVSLAPDAAVPSDDVTLELRDDRGRALSHAAETLDGAAELAASPLSLPAPGTYQLRALGPDGVQTIALHALPEPSASFGGVMGVTAFGLSAGASDYLRQHGFAVTPLAAGQDASAATHIVVGDARLDGTDLDARYRAFWRMVGDGATALVLQPPPPGIAAYWPAIAPLRAPSAAGACAEDALAAPFTGGLADDASLAQLLRPALVYDLQQPHLDAYHWDGRLLLKPKGQPGYPGCHALFSFRYGQGWVTMSTLPLLQHFQDARARMVLLNAIKVMAARKRRIPPSPGLQWITESRLRQMAAQPRSRQDVVASAAALFYRAPPGPTEPAPELVPLDGHGCWSAPAGAGAGATITLDLSRPLAVRSVEVRFGADAAQRPPEFHVAASSDGRAWIPVPASGALPPAPAWRRFVLSILAAPPHWSLCGFSAPGN